MAIQRLNCGNIGSLGDGAARLVIDRALEDIARDLDDRGRDGKPRKVVVTITETQMEGGKVTIELDCKTNIPARVIPPTEAKMTVKNEKPNLFFQQWNAENADQPTFPALDTEGGEVEG